MKKTKRPVAKALSAFLSSVIIFCGMLPTPALGQSDRSAKIFSATGSVSVKRGGDKLLPAFEGMRLEEGDIIIAAADSSAVIEIDGDKTVSVDESTEIALSTLSGNAENSQTGISVFFGNIVNSIQNKLTKGSTFETETPTAIMGVRGTTYLVGQPLDRPPSVLVSSGRVQTDTESGSTMVDPGFAYEAMAEAPEPLSVEKLVSFGPVAVSALADDDFVQSLDGGGSVSLSDLVTAAAEQRAQQRQAQETAETRAMQASVEGAEEAYFFDTPGAKLAGAAQTPANVVSPEAAEPVTVPETAPTVSETQPSSQAQSPAVGTESGMTAAATGTLTDPQSTSDEKKQAGNAHKNSPALPSYSGQDHSSDRNDSDHSNSGGGASQKPDDTNRPDGGDEPAELPKKPPVTLLKAVVKDNGDILVSWSADPTQSNFHITLKIGGVTAELPQSSLHNEGNLYSFSISKAEFESKKYESVTVVVKGDGVASQDSLPVTFRFKDMDDGGDEDNLPKGSITGLEVSDLEGSSYVIRWDKFEGAKTYYVVFETVDGSQHIATEFDFTDPQVKLTVSDDEMARYKAVSVTALDKDEKNLTEPKRLNLSNIGKDKSNGANKDSFPMDDVEDTEDGETED